MPTCINLSTLTIIESFSLQLSNQVISVQEKVTASPRGKPPTSLTATDDSSKSSEQLLEVLR